jgi:hypothetical protein
MSVVTNVLILAPLIEESPEDTYPAIDALNAKLAEHEKGSFVEIGKHAGGRKAFEACVFAAAINYLDLDWFRECIESVPWVSRDEVQVLVCPQSDETFSLFYGTMDRRAEETNIE